MAEFDPDKHCGAQRYNQPTGTLCRRPKGWGTPHPGIGYCKRHGGNTKSHVDSAKVEIARRECAQLGVPIEMDAGEALMQELWETAGNVAFYRALVQELPTHPVAAVRKEVVGGPDDGEVEWEPAKAGVYAPTFHQSGRRTGEAKAHIIVSLYNDERKHFAAVAAAALKAGVEERRVQLAEGTAKSLVQVLMEFARRLGLDPSSPEVREAGRGALTLVAGEPV